VICHRGNALFTESGNLYLRWPPAWIIGKEPALSVCLVRSQKKDIHAPEIVRLVKEIHSYDTPKIIALPIIGGNHDYLDWIGKEVK
jgi:uncharacterized protein involved in tolerance to divalent cations